MTWEEYYLGLAQTVSRKSKDPTQVGCVVVGPEGEIRMTGFNGPPKGVRDIEERFVRPRKYLYASHAEQNAVAFAARVGVSLAGCTIYVTHHPCSSCARSLIQSGITRVVVGSGMTSMPPEEANAAGEMFEEAGIEVRRA